MTDQICLVSEQAAANLLPALDHALKPTRVVLVVTARMQQRAGHLETVLREAGVTVEHLLLRDEHDYQQTQNELLEWATGHADHDVHLNLTGGTKLMALAAQRVAEQAGWRPFYVDVDTDRVTWLDRPGSQPLSEQLRLPHYLSGYGFKASRPQPPSLSEPRQRLLGELILQIGSLEQPLSQLNWLAQQATDGKRLHVELDARQQDSRGLEAILRKFEQAGLLHLRGARLEFVDAPALAFARGGWLEAHVFRVVAQLAQALHVRDKAANLVVEDATGVRNELDVAFLARNRLFLIECKTARMDRPEAPKANDTLFKLAQLGRRIGGLGTCCMLASYRDLGPSEKRLAEALRIELVCGPELQTLDQRLRRWVQP